MQRFNHFLLAGLLIIITGTSYAQNVNTGSFQKVIISPFIEATFIQGDEERVMINNSVVDPDKLHIENKNGVLRVYLEGAKEIPHKSRDKRNGTRDLYPAHAVTATIYFKQLDALSIRGEEGFYFPGLFTAKNFNLKLYGGSAITFANVQINDMQTVIYGESSVDMQSGTVDKQSYTSYGEGRVNSASISSTEAKLTAYGEAQFRLNVSGQIKMTSFGEAKLRYKGNAQIVRGINLGDVDIARIN